MLYQTGGKKKLVINFVVGGAKMAIMVNTEMESERRGGSRYWGIVLKALIAPRIKAEFEYFKIINDINRLNVFESLCDLNKKRKKVKLRIVYFIQ